MKSLKFMNIVRMTMSNKKIPRPRDPTVAESFQTEIGEKEMKILLDPKGFMTDEEKMRE